jgi:NADH:ubiquinone oxidoreductase subunit C
MLERCVRLDAAYTPAYLLLARLYQGQEGRGPAVGRLLLHVARLQPNSPDHLAELAAWLHQQGKVTVYTPVVQCCCILYPQLHVQPALGVSNFHFSATEYPDCFFHASTNRFCVMYILLNITHKFSI